MDVRVRASHIKDAFSARQRGDYRSPLHYALWAKFPGAAVEISMTGDFVKVNGFPYEIDNQGKALLKDAGNGKPCDPKTITLTEKEVYEEPREKQAAWDSVDELATELKTKVNDKDDEVDLQNFSH